MLKGKLIHPEIIASIAHCGHGDKILIADGNYPLAAKTGEKATLVYLGLSDGIPSVNDVLSAIQSVIAIEKAEVMDPANGSVPDIFPEFEEMLGIDLNKLGRYEFYDEASKPDVRLAISTGEKRTFANILITVGCA